MRQTFEAREQKLGSIFTNDYLFRIPMYQRPYAWTTDEAGALLDDLLRAADPEVSIDNAPPYFLGSIVLIKEDLKGALADVVDGQQRLTTLTILLCALRELSDDSADIDDLIRQRGSKIHGTQDQFRLSLREKDQAFFRSNVQTMGGLSRFTDGGTSGFTDSQLRLHENAAYLRRELSLLDSGRREHLAAFLVQSCFLVVVTASDRNAAYRIFSVMNDRGLDLSPTDILKAEIIGPMSETDREEYTSKWEAIEDRLGRDDFRTLFAHIRMIYVRSKAQGSLNEEFKAAVLDHAKDERTFIDDVLDPHSDSYAIVSRAAYESTKDAERVNIYLRHLRRLDNSDWMPPAIAYFKKHQQEEEALCRFVRDLERLAYALFLRRARDNVRIRRYGEVLGAIDRNEDLHIPDSPLQLSAEEKAEMLAALDQPIYGRPRVPVPLLLRLDSQLADAGAMYEHKYVSVEHVLPQSPGPAWLALFPEEEDREYWTHRLANLVLLSRRKNARAQNYAFDQKKKVYFQKDGVAPFALTARVLAEPAWTPEVLGRRQQELIGLLKKEWRL